MGTEAGSMSHFLHDFISYMENVLPAFPRVSVLASSSSCAGGLMPVFAEGRLVGMARLLDHKDGCSLGS